VPYFRLSSVYSRASQLLTNWLVEQLQITTEKSLVLRLSKPLTSSTDKQVATPLVVDHALDLLLKVHREICQRDLQPIELRLESPAERRTIYALLDLLILEAVYPSLSHGVGIPIDRRARSFVLPNQLVRPQNSSKVRVVEENRDSELLRKVVEGLISVLNTPDERLAVQDTATTGVLPPRGYPGIGGMIRDRCLVDLIAGCGELAFNPREDSGAGEWEVKFSRLIEGLVPQIVTIKANAHALVLASLPVLCCPYCYPCCIHCLHRGSDNLCPDISRDFQYHDHVVCKASLNSFFPQLRLETWQTRPLHSCR
jgi:hypothetical protein